MGFETEVLVPEMAKSVKPKVHSLPLLPCIRVKKAEISTTSRLQMNLPPLS